MQSIDKRKRNRILKAKNLDGLCAGDLQKSLDMNKKISRPLKRHQTPTTFRRSIYPASHFEGFNDTRLAA